MWWWYLYYPLHWVDHLFLSIFHKFSLTRNYILPIWIWFTAHIPFTLSIITRISHQHFYLSRMGAISRQWFYMGKSIVVANPEVCRKIFKSPPPQVDKGWIVASIQESGFIAPVMFSTPHPRKDIEFAIDIIAKAQKEHHQDVTAYLDTLEWKDIEGTKIMDVFEHTLFIVFFKNKLSAQKRLELLRANTNLLKIGIILLALIPSKGFARMLGLEKLGKMVRKKIVDSYVEAHGLNLDNPEDRYKAEIFGELFLLNVHAPLTTLPFWILKRMDEHWDHVKTLTTDEELFEFFVEALRLRVAPPDIGWQAKEDFWLDYPELGGGKIFIPKGFGLVVPTCAINLNPQCNPDPFQLKYKLGPEHGRDPKNNIVFGFPLQFLQPGGLDYWPTRGCAGIRMCHFLIPKILSRYVHLKKHRQPSRGTGFIVILAILVAAVAVGVGIFFYPGALDQVRSYLHI